jgi:hypothetical protein
MGQSRHFDRGPAPSGLSRSTDIVRPARYVGLVPVATKSDGHHHLFGRGLTLTVDLGPALYGPGVVRVRREQFLLLQLSDELGPARLDRIVARLRQCNERKRLENWFSVVG